MHRFARIMSVTCVHILEFQEKCRRSVFASAIGGRSKPKAHIHNKLIIIEYYSFFMSEDNASALFAGCARCSYAARFLSMAEWLSRYRWSSRISPFSSAPFSLPSTHTAARLISV
jgi:hypothetical protein